MLRNGPDQSPNLTSFELEAIDSGINLSDGHPRQDLTLGQRAIVDDLPRLFHRATSEALIPLQVRSQRAFMDALGQISAPVEVGRVYSIYASSIGTSVLGYVMAKSTERIALLHPTFDNIHDLLRRHVDLIPLDESFDARTAPATAASKGATAMFITTPNNPTGRYLNEVRLRELVDGCVKHDLTLCLDTSFRGFESRAHFDHYAVLERSGVRYVVIEDTGKLWPVLELKLGFIAVSRHWRAEFEEVLSDVLLSVSPLILALVERLSQDAANGGLEDLHKLIASNRYEVERVVDDMADVSCMDEDARVSVARIQFPGSYWATRVHEELRSREIHVLPCGPFHWTDPGRPGDALRVALGRNASDIVHAMAEMRTVWDEVRRDHI